MRERISKWAQEMREHFGEVLVCPECGEELERGNTIAIVDLNVGNLCPTCLSRDADSLFEPYRMETKEEG